MTMIFNDPPCAQGTSSLCLELSSPHVAQKIYSVLVHIFPHCIQQGSMARSDLDHDLDLDAPSPKALPHMSAPPLTC